MNKKGFTLVEVLGVIAVLAVIMTISVMSISGIRDKSLKKILETKIEQIEQAGILYGQENPDSLSNTSCGEITTINKEGEESKFTPEFCMDITVGDLIDGNYIEKKYLEDDYDMINDVTNKSMKEDTVTVYRKNNRIYATMKEIKSNS